MLTTKEKTKLLFVHDNVVHLRQGIDLLRSISDVQFVATIPPVFANCAGVHIRHIIDQFNCFFDGVQCGRIDYDRRARNRDIEQNRELAIKSLEQVIIQMEKINDDSNKSFVEVKMDGGDADDEHTWSPSSVSRELQFLSSHTIHHYSLVAAILGNIGCDLPAGFGVSPSTLIYQRKRRAQAR